MGPRVAALVLAAIVYSPAAHAQAVGTSYTDIVTMYRAGNFDAALDALQKMAPIDVKDSVTQLVLSIRTGKWREGIEPIKAVAMLHTELAIATRARTGPSDPGLWVDANRLMGPVGEQDPHSAFVRDWRLLMTAYLQGQGDFFIAMDYARGTWKPIVIRQTDRHPRLIPKTPTTSTLPSGLVGDDDAELRLAVGTIHEMVWAHDREAGGTHPRGDLGVAAGELRQALALRPDLVEARVRLGRVLTLDRKYEEAARVFADLGDVSDPRFRYLAGLFEGNLAERRGDAARAEVRYLAAIEAAPAAQAARMALAHLRHAAGNRVDAATRVRALASDQAARDVDDPWLWYLKGMSWRADGYLARLRDAIHPAGAR